MQQTQDVEKMLVQCCSSVVDGGPALNQPWFNVSCVLIGISLGNLVRAVL